MRKFLRACLALALFVVLAAWASPEPAAAQSDRTKASAASTVLPGRWVYRSLKNNPDPSTPVGDLSLLVGIIEIPAFSGDRFEGTLTATEHGVAVRHILKGKVQGDRFTMEATQGNAETAGWVYEYVGWVAPKWEKGVDQTPTFVGSVLRVTEHPFPGGGTSASGGTYTIFGVKTK